LTTVSKSHTVYLVDNLATGHNETQGLPGYTGIDAVEKEGGEWLIDDADYAWLCQAFETFDRQLSVASLGGIAKAEARMMEGLLKAEGTRALAEASA
jgi:hypothetical protein